MKVINTVVASFLALGLIACSGKKQETNSGVTGAKQAAEVEMSGDVNIDGSSTVFPISEAVAEEFGRVHDEVRVSVGVSGTGGGFKKFIAKEIDIADASRAIKMKEIVAAQKAGVEFIELPIAYDGLSVVVNKENDFVDYLSVAELKKIWEPGSKVSKWSEVRDGWPAEEIKLYGPGTDSGTFDYFTEAVNGKSGASRPDYTSSEDDNVIVNGVSGDKYSLGFFGYAYFDANRDLLKVVPIDGGNGPVTPTNETINNGKYAPLSRPIFIYVNPTSLDRPQVKAFAEFYLDNAAKLAEEVGYIRLPKETYAKAKARLEAREVGTAYHEEADVKVPKL